MKESTAPLTLTLILCVLCCWQFDSGATTQDQQEMTFENDYRQIPAAPFVIKGIPVNQSREGDQVEVTSDNGDYKPYVDEVANDYTGFLYYMMAPQYYVTADEETDKTQAAPQKPAQAASSQPASGMSDEERQAALARESSNPLGKLWSLNFVFDNRFKKGDITNDYQNVNTMSFQPVIPMPLPQLGEGWMLVSRPTFPFIINSDTPQAGGGFDNDKWKFGDISFFSLLGKNIPMKSKLLGDGTLVVAAGPTFTFPTGSNGFSSDKYTAGPAGALFFIGKKWIVGTLAQHWWDYSGSGDNSVSSSNIQISYFRNLPGGWQVGGSPQTTINWEADSGDKYNVPIGLGVYKIVKFGKLPVKLGIEAQYSVIHEDTYGQRWNLKFNVTPIIPALVHWPWEGDLAK